MIVRMHEGSKAQRGLEDTWKRDAEQNDAKTKAVEAQRCFGKGLGGTCKSHY
jgi:hypothetical protein